MNAIATFGLVALTLTACQADPAHHNAERAHAAATAVEYRIFAFQHQSALEVANHARAELGQPPMAGVVHVECDARNNSWLVQATQADMSRVEALVARYDAPVEAPWKKAP